MPKIPCVKVTRPDTHGNMWCLYEAAKFSAADEFDGAEVGEQIVLEYCEMTREELDTIPELRGFEGVKRLFRWGPFGANC